MAIYWRGILRYASIVTLVACLSLVQVVTGEGGTPTEHGAAGCASVPVDNLGIVTLLWIAPRR
jgi:hypothetical protein